MSCIHKVGVALSPEGPMISATLHKNKECVGRFVSSDAQPT